MAWIMQFLKGERQRRIWYARGDFAFTRKAGSSGQAQRGRDKKV